jgi:hypothetical protein
MMFNVSKTLCSLNFIFDLYRAEQSPSLFQIISILTNCFQKELITVGTQILIKLWNHVDKKWLIKIWNLKDLIRN